MTLKELRLQNKKTAAEVAVVLGVSERAIYNYEQGIRSINLEQVILLSTLYDVTEKEIIELQLGSINVRKSD